jgi:hypothetical protein
MVPILLLIGFEPFCIPVDVVVTEGDSTVSLQWDQPAAAGSLADGSFYLLYDQADTADMVAFGFGLGGEVVALGEFVPYPDMFNKAKAHAVLDLQTGELSVYSQYPFTANYFLATYRVGDNGSLQLLAADGHDYYLEALQDMRAVADSADLEGVVLRAWSVMYPHANPYDEEMCVVLLRAGMDKIEALVRSGAPPEEALEWLEDLYDVADNLLVSTPTGTKGTLHRAIVDPRDYPEMADVGLEEYTEMLRSLADLLEETENEEMAEEVRAVVHSLTQPGGSI